MTTRDTFHGLADVKGAELLTPREREVLGRVIAGASNKEAGRTLGIGPRTSRCIAPVSWTSLRQEHRRPVRIVVGQGQG